ncbi:hypothetical protein [Algoriphagus confluentis]|uniref:DUF5723 domain-containing protein n=1 Tax=Algoriphagus confluentis TaxID=1697556 RepID=A0ABQ6PNS1_9BACT|nr:hypothetical protein Aconfl_10900 [Algoriphagus confluentis]
MSTLVRIFLTTLFVGCLGSSFSQELINKRPTFYAYSGFSGANLTQFNQMLNERGLSSLRNRYSSIGLGYQTRINDFVLGFDLGQHTGKASQLDDMRIRYRTTRALLNIGYSMTEEGRFQLIHYLGLGFGFMNFQMLPEEQDRNLELFLLDSQQGFILRKNDIHQGTSQFGNFLTEIGFQLSYDFPIPGRKEALQVMARGGYSFSPIENSWNMNGIAFDNAQSGAFIRVGAGISLPERNFFYKDATIGISLVRGVHNTKPDALNGYLESFGYQPLEGKPSNWGLRILGDTEGLLYGVDVFNLAMSGQASNFQEHSLNSVRVYANGGFKLIQFENFALGALGGLGYGNLRYTLSDVNKPDFPELLEDRYFDGYLRSSGVMIKPEVFLEYGLPLTKRKLFDLVFSASAGYELAFPGYSLGEISMNQYMSGSYLLFGIGVRP